MASVKPQFLPFLTVLFSQDQISLLNITKVFFACQVTLQLNRSNCHGDTTCHFFIDLLSTEGHSYFSGELNPKGLVRICTLTSPWKEVEMAREEILICIELSEKTERPLEMIIYTVLITWFEAYFTLLSDNIKQELKLLFQTLLWTSFASGIPFQCFNCLSWIMSGLWTGNLNIFKETLIILSTLRFMFSIVSSPTSFMKL